MFQTNHPMQPPDRRVNQTPHRCHQLFSKLPRKNPRQLQLYATEQPPEPATLRFDGSRQHFLVSSRRVCCRKICWPPWAFAPVIRANVGLHVRRFRWSLLMYELPGDESGGHGPNFGVSYQGGDRQHVSHDSHYHYQHRYHPGRYHHGPRESAKKVVLSLKTPSERWLNARLTQGWLRRDQLAGQVTRKLPKAVGFPSGRRRMVMHRSHGTAFMFLGGWWN